MLGFVRYLLGPLSYRKGASKIGLYTNSNSRLQYVVLDDLGLLATEVIVEDKKRDEHDLPYYTAPYNNITYRTTQ